MYCSEYLFLKPLQSLSMAVLLNTEWKYATLPESLTAQDHFIFGKPCSKPLLLIRCWYKLVQQICDILSQLCGSEVQCFLPKKKDAQRHIVNYLRGSQGKPVGCRSV